MTGDITTWKAGDPLEGASEPTESLTTTDWVRGWIAVGLLVAAVILAFVWFIGLGCSCTTAPAP